MRFATSLALLAATIASVSAQTWSDCNPMNRTDCSPDVALGMNYTWDLVDGEFDDTAWNITAGSITYGTEGAEFIIAKELDSPTIQSNFYIFWGVVEFHVKASTGQGVISSMVLESDDLDEVDWEFVGSENTTVQSNYYGKGNTTSYDRMVKMNVTSPMDGFHNYTTHWTSEKVEWYIDGELLRTLEYGDAVGGYNYPQTPMTVRLGIWPGGDPSQSNGTIEWAGGEINYDDVPYTMTVSKVRVQDFSSGKSYTYGDETGSFDSITINSGNSTIKTALLTSDETTTEKAVATWSGLSTTAKIGIAAGVCGGFAIFASVFAFCFIKQRRAGRKEYENMTKEWDAQQAQQMLDQKEWRAARAMGPKGNRF